MFPKIVTLVPRILMILALFYNVNAIDLQSAKEGSCIKINETAAVNLTWVTKQRAWYLPVSSKYDLWHTVVDLTGKDPKDISEHEVYYESCLTLKFAENGFSAKGFGDKRLNFNIKPIRGLEEFEFTSVNPEGAKMNGALCHITLTDNKTFMFLVCCMDEGQMTWGAPSTVKEHSAETKKLIYDHAESLGLKREYFTQFRYINCKPERKMYNLL